MNRSQLTTESSTRGTAYTNPFTHDGGTAGGPGNVTAFKSSTANRSYNADNELTNTGFTYDGNGSPTLYNTKALTFDPEQRLSSYAGSTQTNGYDGDGLRTWKQKGAATTRTYFLYDGALPVCEFTSTGALSATNTFGAGGLISRRVGSTTTLYAFDERGNVSQRLSSTGAVTSSDLYDGYGARTSTVPVQPDPFGYGGQFGYYTDTETGLILCTHRFYDPAAGRFVTRDPIGYGGGINLYGYTRNNPINKVDPSGLDSYLVHPTNSGGYVSLAQSYTMDIPNGVDIGSISSNFGQVSPYIPPLALFFLENRNGAKYDFKKNCPASKDPNSLYHKRALGGNFLYGAEAAAAGWSLDEAIGGGDDFRRFGAGTHPVNLLKDVFDGNGNNLFGDLYHPLDEQQAIQDGYFWYKRNQSK